MKNGRTRTDKFNPLQLKFGTDILEFVSNCVIKRNIRRPSMSSSAYQGLKGSAAVTIYLEPSIAHKIDLLSHAYIAISY